MSATRNKERQADFFNTCGKCKAGYSCCFGTRPPISPERSRIIREYLTEHGIRIKNPFVTEDYAYPRETAAGFCVFHNQQTRKCLIHSVKPETCVAGPITFDINTKNGKIEWFIKKEEICPLAGAVHRDKLLLQKHIEAAKQELEQLLQNLDARALVAILLKEEPETFKIGEDNLDRRVLDGLNATCRDTRPEGSS